MPLRAVGNCQYTPINTAGTTTLNPGQPGNPAIDPGVFYGVEQLAPGTGFLFTVYDIVPATPNAAVSTNTLLNGTGSAGQVFAPGPAGIGVRYRGALVVVTAGTPGAINALWD